MGTKLRIATFNLENLDDRPDTKPTLAERIAIMRPQLLRVNADILCLQEVHGQETPGNPRQLLALEKLLQSTPYSQYYRISSLTDGGREVFEVRNLVILSRYEIVERYQYQNKFAIAPLYRPVTADPPATSAQEVTWDRPILHAKIKLPNGQLLNVINLHLKSKLPTTIPGQKLDDFTWKTSAGWAEGFFISSMRRVGQALEVRLLVDSLFDEDENALILVGGDLNADADEVPVEAICGGVEKTQNSALAKRTLIPCERSIPEPGRFSILHDGKGRMLDHLLISRDLFSYYQGAEIHNELLHDESGAFGGDKLYPQPDHAPLIASFELPGS